MNLARILTARAAEAPHRLALRFEGARISYGELDRRAAVAAGALRARGVQPGDRVAIRLPNSPAYVAAFFGALRAGAIAVPLNVLLADAEVEQRTAVAMPATLVESELPTAGKPLWEVVDRGDADPASLLFTSGTTGGAKGAILTHGGIHAAARNGVDALALGPEDVVLGVAPFPHVLGQQVLVATLLAGGAIAVERRFEAAQTLATMTETGTTVLIGVPTMCISLCQSASGARALPPLRVAHVGGAPVPTQVAAEFERTFGAPVHDGYGLTEMSGLATTFTIDRRRKPGSVGKPLSGTEIRIARPDGRGVGEVQFRGPSVIPGYWNDPEASAAAIDAAGWLSTGDLGYLDADGDLFLVDRKKEMIIRGGYNVYPREVEEVLFSHPAVAEAAVVGVPHETLGEEVTALVVLRPGATAAPEALQAWAKERLAAYKYPRRVVLVDELPKGPTGKVLKRAIEGAALAADV